MVIKSGPWGVINAHKVIKQLPCRVGTLEPGGWGPQCPKLLGRQGLALSCLGVEPMIPGCRGAGAGEPGREAEGEITLSHRQQFVAAIRELTEPQPSYSNIQQVSVGSSL